MNGCRKVMRSRRGKAAKEKGRWREGDKAQERCQEGGERRAKTPCRRTMGGGGRNPAGGKGPRSVFRVIYSTLVSAMVGFLL